MAACITFENTAALAKLAAMYPTPAPAADAKDHGRKEGKRTTAGGGALTLLWMAAARPRRDGARARAVLSCCAVRVG